MISNDLPGRWCVIIFFVLVSVVNAAGIAVAMELSIPSLTVDSGEPVLVPVKVDRADNLAGIKLVLTYDPEVLVFVKAAKTAGTARMVHVVNDRVPGKLIIVMAAAKGIRGEDISIMELTFRIAVVRGEGLETTIRIIESQLMSDALKELEHGVRPGILAIQAAAGKGDSR